MFQDQARQDKFKALSAEKQIEVADFIHFLHQRQAEENTEDPNQAKIAELLLGQNASDDPESNAIWDELMAMLED